MVGWLHSQSFVRMVARVQCSDEVSGLLFIA